jgi:hypothetical protein
VISCEGTSDAFFSRINIAFLRFLQRDRGRFASRFYLSPDSRSNSAKCRAARELRAFACILFTTL